MARPREVVQSAVQTDLAIAKIAESREKAALMRSTAKVNSDEAHDARVERVMKMIATAKAGGLIEAEVKLQAQLAELLGY